MRRSESLRFVWKIIYLQVNCYTFSSSCWLPSFWNKKSSNILPWSLFWSPQTVRSESLRFLLTDYLLTSKMFFKWFKLPIVIIQWFKATTSFLSCCREWSCQRLLKGAFFSFKRVWYQLKNQGEQEKNCEIFFMSHPVTPLCTYLMWQRLSQFLLLEVIAARSGCFKKWKRDNQNEMVSFQFDCPFSIFFICSFW